MDTESGERVAGGIGGGVVMPTKTKNIACAGETRKRNPATAYHPLRAACRIACIPRGVRVANRIRSVTECRTDNDFKT